jgi:hypothetical protein
MSVLSGSGNPIRAPLKRKRGLRLLRRELSPGRTGVSLIQRIRSTGEVLGFCRVGVSSMNLCEQ